MHLGGWLLGKTLIWRRFYICTLCSAGMGTGKPPSAGAVLARKQEQLAQVKQALAYQKYSEMLAINALPAPVSEKGYWLACASKRGRSAMWSKTRLAPACSSCSGVEWALIGGSSPRRRRPRARLRSGRARSLQSPDSAAARCPATLRQPGTHRARAWCGADRGR